MSRKRAQKADYKVGYGKPPKEAQFQKGTSGHPGGRPRKPASMGDVLLRALNETVMIVHNRQEKTVTKMEAVVNRLLDKAILGEIAAVRLLTLLIQTVSDSPNVSGKELEELDNKVLASLFKKLSSGAEG